MSSGKEAPYKLIELSEGDWNDWHFEQQQLMIVVHVTFPEPLLMSEHNDSRIELNLHAGRQAKDGCPEGQFCGVRLDLGALYQAPP